MAVRKKRLLATTILSMLLFSAVAAVQPVNSEETNLLSSASFIAMPEEYINYTIASINGTLWAKIDGTYPLQILFEPERLSDSLPLVYPTPPGTTNITIIMDEKELAGSTY